MYSKDDLKKMDISEAMDSLRDFIDVQDFQQYCSDFERIFSVLYRKASTVYFRLKDLNGVSVVRSN